MPREQRGGKVTEPISIRKWGSRSTAKPSGDVVPTYEKVTTTTPVDGSQGEDFGEILTETQGQLTGFEDTRGGIRKFLDTLSGRPSTANQLNAQLALGREQSDRAFTQAKELEGIRSTADLTKVREESKLRREEKDLDSLNAIKIAQEKARLDLRKAVLDNDLKAKDDAENHLRSLAADKEKTINTIAQQRGVLPDQMQQFAPMLLQQAEAKAQSDIEASKAAGSKSKVEQGIEASRLSAIGGPEGTKIPRTTALSSVTEPMLKPEVENRKNSLFSLDKDSTGFGGGYGEKPTTVYTPGQQPKPGVLGQPGTPAVPPSVRTMKDPDAIRAELDALRSAANVSRNPVAAGQFFDVGNQGVVAAPPQTTTRQPSWIEQNFGAAPWAKDSTLNLPPNPYLGQNYMMPARRQPTVQEQQNTAPTAPSQRTTAAKQALIDVLNQILR